MKSSYRIRVLVLVIAIVLLTLWFVAASQAQTSPTAIRSVGPVSTTVSNMEGSIAFYTNVLSFRVADDHEATIVDSNRGAPLHARVVTMKLGQESLEFVQPDPASARSNADSHSNDLWFQHVAIVVSDMDRAYTRLQASHVEGLSRAPQRLPDWNTQAAGIRAYYFKDPDGHPLELLQFPSNKGDAKWHGDNGQLFLGIDHTAIVVANTEASLRFYRDQLGMHIAGKSENYGAEQEALNNVPGAHLRITSLRASDGFGIELLEYVQPKSGRKLDDNPAISDVTHRSTYVYTSNPEGLAKVVSPSATRRDSKIITFDPDGHEIVIAADQAQEVEK